MDYKDIFIILLILLIIVTSKKNLNLEKFSADPQCMGLSAPLEMSCGNYLVDNQYCLPDPNDCFILNNEKKCWCKIIKNI